MQEHKSVLIFCGTRPNVEHTASEVAQMCEAGLFTISERATVFNSGNSASKRAQFLADLPRATPPNLLRCLRVGVGFHHAGASFICPPCTDCSADVRCRAVIPLRMCTHMHITRRRVSAHMRVSADGSCQTELTHLC